MRAYLQNFRRTDLTWLISVQVGLFVGYHLVKALHFGDYFDYLAWRFTLANHVMIFMATWGTWVWTYGAAGFFLWLAFSNRPNVLLPLICSAVVGYCAWFWQYPVLTAFLVALRQFDDYTTL